MDRIKLIGGSSNFELVNNISNHLGINLVDITLDSFNNSERQVEINENIRSNHVFILQTGAQFNNNTINDHLVELVLMADACKRADAKSITIITPCFFYSRSDKKDKGGVPIGASAIITMLSPYYDRIIAMDLHASQIQGFDIKPIHNLYAVSAHIDAFYNLVGNDFDNNNYVIVSPDNGGTKRADDYAERMGLPVMVMHKQRNYNQKGKIEKIILLGDSDDLKNKTVILVDDMVDSMGTMIAAINELGNYEIKNVIVIATHGIFSDKAFERINNCDLLKNIIVTNTICQENNFEKCNKLIVADISNIFAEAIRIIATGKGAVSDLFK